MADDPSAVLAEIRKREHAATPGPWWFDEDDLMWRLHGVHAVLSPFMEGFPLQVINHQILKAPKQGTTYAEYWPNEADAAFIVAARTDVPRLLAALDAALALHEPRQVHGGTITVCGHDTDAGGGTLLVTWPCPTYAAILAALNGKEAPGVETD